MRTFSKFGDGQECSDDLLLEVENSVYYMYGKPNYSDVYKLRFDALCKRYEITCNTLNSCDTIDLGLLPPCIATLNMHTRRANYPTYMPMKDIPACMMFKIVPGIEYVLIDSGIVPSELVDILCTKLQEDKTNQNEDVK
ncbi:hypothetical protein DPMN_000652 [Dreissena polymorpha]|uniref:Uncharacterized protein n=1 Tax=Dreissena polymorpha TaxID=45954 RepID=A0A9D4MFS6_DREPO|nr:hypothetical protein DPMN_000652 [Dreissena polymorpha]